MALTCVMLFHRIALWGLACWCPLGFHCAIVSSLIAWCSSAHIGKHRQLEFYMEVFTFVHFFCTVCCRLLYSDPKSSSSSIERYVSGTVASIGACLILLLLRYGTFSCLAQRRFTFTHLHLPCYESVIPSTLLPDSSHPCHIQALCMPARVTYKLCHACCVT